MIKGISTQNFIQPRSGFRLQRDLSQLNRVKTPTQNYITEKLKPKIPFIRANKSWQGSPMNKARNTYISRTPQNRRRKNEQVIKIPNIAQGIDQWSKTRSNLYKNQTFTQTAACIQSFAHNFKDRNIQNQQKRSIVKLHKRKLSVLNKEENKIENLSGNKEDNTTSTTIYEDAKQFVQLTDFNSILDLEEGQNCYINYVQPMFFFNSNRKWSIDIQPSGFNCKCRKKYTKENIMELFFQSEYLPANFLQRKLPSLQQILIRQRLNGKKVLLIVFDGVLGSISHDEKIDYSNPKFILRQSTVKMLKSLQQNYQIALASPLQGNKFLRIVQYFRNKGVQIQAVYNINLHKYSKQNGIQDSLKHQFLEFSQIIKDFSIKSISKDLIVICPCIADSSDIFEKGLFYNQGLHKRSFVQYCPVESDLHNQLPKIIIVPHIKLYSQNEETFNAKCIEYIINQKLGKQSNLIFQIKTNKIRRQLINLFMPAIRANDIRQAHKTSHIYSKQIVLITPKRQVKNSIPINICQHHQRLHYNNPKTETIHQLFVMQNQSCSHLFPGKPKFVYEEKIELHMGILSLLSHSLT